MFEFGLFLSLVDGNDFFFDEERFLFGYEFEIGKEMGFYGEESGMLFMGKFD